MTAAARADEVRLPMPKDMAGRPIDHRGFPLPWFVTNRDPAGHWDFVHIDKARFDEAIRRELCWGCHRRAIGPSDDGDGVPLGRYRSFFIGPMCVVNRVAGDPPVKTKIAEWSVAVCPFLSRPLARRDRSLTAEDYASQRGVMLERNPGVSAIYTIRGDAPVRDGLFHLPEPTDVTWWARGRPARHDEVQAAMASGLGDLEKMATEEGPAAEAELARCVERAKALLPQIGKDPQ